MTNQIIFQEAKKRMPNQRENIVNKLREAGSAGVLNTELVKECIRFNARISELYAMGYKIEVEHVERGIVRYILISEPAVIRTNVPTAIQTLYDEIADRYKGAITPDELLKLLEEKNFNVVRKAGSNKAS